MTKSLKLVKKYYYLYYKSGTFKKKVNLILTACQPVEGYFISFHKLGNLLFRFILMLFLYSSFFPVIWYRVFLSNKSNLHTVVCFQVFQSNSYNYMMCTCICLCVCTHVINQELWFW